MIINLLKAGLVSLFLSAGGFAHAGLIAYDYQGSGAVMSVTGTVIFETSIVTGGTVSIDVVDSYEFVVTEQFGGLFSLRYVFSSSDQGQPGGRIRIDSVSGKPDLALRTVTRRGDINRLEISRFGWIFSDPSEDAGDGDGTWGASRQVVVPEPSTLAIFALGIMGLASRRFMKQS